MNTVWVIICFEHVLYHKHWRKIGVVCYDKDLNMYSVSQKLADKKALRFKRKEEALHVMENYKRSFPQKIHKIKVCEIIEKLFV